MANVKAYLYAAFFAALAFFGIYMHRAGKASGEAEHTRRRVDAMRTAKDVRDEVQDDPYLVDRAARWVRKDD